MRASYVDYSSRAMVNLSDLGGGLYEVNRINTPAPARGQGIARKLVAEMLSDADMQKATLVLDINPYGDMDYQALRAWYERLGFKEEADGRFYRRPAC